MGERRIASAAEGRELRSGTGDRERKRLEHRALHQKKHVPATTDGESKRG